MESDPYLALAEDCRKFGNIHNRPVERTEVLAKAVAQFKQAIGEAQKQVFFNQKLSLSLANELKVKDRMLQQEQKTTDKLIQDKKDLIMMLAEKNERVLMLEARLKTVMQQNEAPPPLPPKSKNTLSQSLNNLQLNE